ncbi:MAG: hypothetical protein HZA68_10010 [Rhodovulum sp.]|nr:hypothetical protein [Rhodovulum sp.]
MTGATRGAAARPAALLVTMGLAALSLAACATPSTTAPNTAPLELGMTPAAAAMALGAPLEPISGPPGSEVYVARVPAGTPGIFTVDGLVWLQFRKGRLTGIKRDWHVGPKGGLQSRPF